MPFPREDLRPALSISLYFPAPSDRMIATTIRVATAAGLGGIAGLLGGLFGVGGGFLVIPPVGVFLWHGSANRAGHRPDNGGTECRVGIFALSATLRRRSAHGGHHPRVGFDCNLSGGPFGDLSRPLVRYQMSDFDH
jgi:hypothetical protein